MLARVVSVALIGVALLVGGSMATASLAQDKKVAPKASAAQSGLRECRTKGQGGKVLTWTCKTEQPCCYNATQNIGVCGSPVLGCF